jgi:hypothetical protein
MPRHFPACAICGLPGHKAKDCGLRDLEARKDPFGEEARRAGYRRRTETRKLFPLSAPAPQFSRPL